MIFYTTDATHNKLIKKYYKDNIMCIDYTHRHALYTIAQDTIPWLNSINEYGHIIIHSLSNEDLTFLKLHGVSMWVLHYQDQLLTLYNNKELRTGCNIFGIA